VTSGASTNPAQYTGRENDGTGLHYYRARYYHPGLQRFISEDPIGNETGEVNFYVYVGNDPINYVDPFGFDRECGFGQRFATNFARTNRALTFDLFSLPFNVPLYGDKAHVNPVRFAAGVAASADFFTKTGIPGPIRWAWNGFQPLRGYVPIATTLGLASAGRIGAGVIVGVGWGVKTVAILGAFEAGVAVGSAFSAAVQPLWDPIWGPGSGCR
jgi:RHS repeat-associated protein